MPKTKTPRISALSGALVKKARSQARQKQGQDDADAGEEHDHAQQEAARVGHAQPSICRLSRRV